jgi:hypothetical protein
MRIISEFSFASFASLQPFFFKYFFIYFISLHVMCTRTTHVKYTVEMKSTEKRTEKYRKTVAKLIKRIFEMRS